MLYSIGQVSKLVDKPTTTIRYWETNGMLIPTKISNGKTRYYSDVDLDKVFGKLDYNKLKESNIEK